MGVALITTLMGLVVSIFLNLFTTQTHGYFRRRIDKATDLGNQFRLRLHQLEQSLESSFRDFDGETDSKAAAEEEDYQLSEAVVTTVDEQIKQSDLSLNKDKSERDIQKVEDNSCKLIPISGDNQQVEVNNRLEKSLVVQVSNNNGNGIADKTLVFEVVKGNGKLTNGRKQEEVLTDASGLAQANLILGSIAGKNKVCVKLKGSENSEIYFEAFGKPTEPEKMIYVSGNHQNEKYGKELSNPLVIKVIDRFDNPVPNWPVTYKVIKGRGYFPEKKSTFITKTDENGLSEAYFTLGDKPGFNSVRATAKGIKKAKFEFEALGQG
jgi:hypothetical protein